MESALTLPSICHNIKEGVRVRGISDYKRLCFNICNGSGYNIERWGFYLQLSCSMTAVPMMKGNYNYYEEYHQLQLCYVDIYQTILAIDPTKVLRQLNDISFMIVE